MQCNILIICISYGIMSSLANDEHSIDETDENDLSERKLLMAEEPLRDYLGYYGEFISEKDADWCPEICESATTIYESPNLRSYCTCEDKKNTVKYDCPAHEIFNRTLGVCSKLPGGGTASCVLKNHNCPKNHRGLIAHPDRNLFQDYILCMDNLVIVAICDDMYYYDSDDKICRKMNIEDTYLSASDCPIIPGIECSEPGIIPMNDGQVFENRPCPSEGFFRYNQSCSMHYECYYSERHKKIVASRLYECPNCLQFNAKVSRCDLPESVPECSIHDPTYQYVQGYRITKPVKICTGPGIFADPVDSKKFYECADIFDENINYLTVSSCPHGTHFNPHTKQCEQEYVRQKNYNLLGGCKTKKYAFHKSSCQTFFYCVDETKSVEMKCLDGYMFNGQFCQLKVQTVYCNWEPLKKNLFKHYNKY